MSDSKGITAAGVKIRNLAGFEKIECKFSTGVSYLYGKNGSGKTRLMTSIVACINGIAEQVGKFMANRFLFIGKNGPSGDVEWEFNDNRTGQNFFIKNHVTKQSNQITFRKGNGSPLTGDWLYEFLNVSLMSSKNFCAMSGQDQAKTLGIDVSSFDKEMEKYKTEATGLRARIKAFGEIEVVEPVEPVDLEAIEERRKEIATKLNNLYGENRRENQRRRDEHQKLVNEESEKARVWGDEQDKRSNNIDMAHEALDDLIEIGYTGKEVAGFIGSLPKPEQSRNSGIPTLELIEPELPDSSELDAIDTEKTEAIRTNERAKEYKEYLKKIEDKKELEKELIENKAKQDECEKQKRDYMSQHNFGFKGLEVDDKGCLTLNGRPLNDTYFSKGELEIIVAKIAASLNPLFKTRFIDEFYALDPDNQKKIIDDLLEMGIEQIIIAVPGEDVTHDNALILRECAIVGTNDDNKKPLI